jgi:cell division protein FtsX
MSQNGKITTIYSVSLLLATLSGLMFYSSNVQEMSTIYYPVHTVEAKTKTNTVLVQPKED